MKVLMLGWEFPPRQSGGLGTACAGLVEGLLGLDCEVTFVMPGLPAAAGVSGERRETGHVSVGLRSDSAAAGFRLLTTSTIPSPHPPGEDRGRLEEVARKARQVSPARDTLRFLRIPSPLQPYQTAAHYRSATATIRGPETSATPSALLYGQDMAREVERYAVAAARSALDHTFDIVHANDWMTLPAALEIAERSRKPLVWHVHSTEFDRRPEPHLLADRGRRVPSYRGLFNGPPACRNAGYTDVAGPSAAVRAIEQRGLDIADRVVAVSRYTADMLRAHYRVDESKLRIVHNGVRHYAPKSRPMRHDPRPMVLFLGRLTSQKGPELFLRAAARVLETCPNTRFVIAGEGDRYPALLEEVERLGIGTQVHFTGFLDGEDVERMYAIADIYVMPSVSEPFGISALEALSAEVPVIISERSGVAEVITNAIKVDPSDVEAMADHITDLLAHPEKRERMVRRGRAELEGLRWETRARALLDVYREIRA